MSGTGTQEVFVAEPGSERQWVATVPGDIIQISIGAPCFVCGAGSTVSAINYTSNIFECGADEAMHPLPSKFMQVESDEDSMTVLILNRFGEVTERISGTLMAPPADVP